VARREQRPATLEDLERLPDTMVGEILDGELVATPRPAPSHARVTTALAGDLFGPFDRTPGGPGAPGGWWLLFEPELHLRADALVSDVAGWRRERMPQIPRAAAIELAPDWVCEVLSPRTARHDRRQKMRIYAREGVTHLWLVDPDLQILEVYHRDGPQWVTAGTYGEDEKVRAEPFEEIELDLARLWIA